jgi:2-keto-4-pentenoate hydratase/2-oxohepta-3-ene-1,7-dioic acid hydratase in catechol pathway
MPYSLATLRVNGEVTPVLEVGKRIYRLSDAAPAALLAAEQSGLVGIFQNWSEIEGILASAADRLVSDPAGAPELDRPTRLEDWLTPLQYPRKVICTGFNYRDHVTRDTKHEAFNKDDNVPAFFLKPPSTSLVGQGRSVRYPTQSTQLDYEIELAVIIGRMGRRINESDAMDHVAGYSIAFDLSARDWQAHPKHAARFDLFGGKAFDDSAPLGPGIVPAAFVDERDLMLEFRLNGEVRQRSSSSNMIWSIPEQIALISQHLTLEPGDVILTGTPAGVGLTTGTWVTAGDTLEGTITGLGTLTVEVIDGDSFSRTRDEQH